MKVLISAAGRFGSKTHRLIDSNPEEVAHAFSLSSFAPLFSSLKMLLIQAPLKKILPNLIKVCLFGKHNLFLQSQFQVVRKLQEYIINYEGLKTGSHTFDFQIKDDFFREFFDGETEFSHADLKVIVHLLKDPTMLVFDFEIPGTVNLCCDRCLDDFRQPIEIRQKLIVKFGEEDLDDDDTMITLPRSEYEINLAPYIYDYIMLAIPMKRLCQNDVSGSKICNQDMVERIKAYENSGQSTKESDPRWDALKKLMDNN